MVFPLQYNMCCLSLCQICNSFIYTEQRREANSSIQALSLRCTVHVLLMHCSLCVLYPTTAQRHTEKSTVLLLQIDYFHLSLSVLTSSHTPLCNIRSMREPAYYGVGSAPRNINNSTLLCCP